MRISESFMSALKSLSGNKVRSFLTMFGIIIGIGSVILITSIGKGSQDKIFSDLSKITKNIVILYTNSSAKNFKRRDFLSIKDKTLVGTHQDISNLTPVIERGVVLQTEFSKDGQRTRLSGAEPAIFDIDQYEFLSGRKFTEGDNFRRRRIIIIDSLLAMNVFGRTDVVGEEVEVRSWRGKYKYLVTGVIKNPFETLGNMLQFEQYIALAPINTLVKDFRNRFVYYKILVKDPDKLETVASDVIKALERKKRNKDVYEVQILNKEMDSFQNIMRNITAFVGFVAAISLIVGGIGVMNIMLVTVTERTREIGIRKAIGAKNSHIMLQFLIESVILTGIGGVLGVIFGYSGGVVVGHFLKVTPKLSLVMLLLAFSVSSLIGIVFGVIPARKAAMLDPIEALRHE